MFAMPFYSVATAIIHYNEITINLTKSRFCEVAILGSHAMFL